MDESPGAAKRTATGDDEHASRWDKDANSPDKQLQRVKGVIAVARNKTLSEPAPGTHIRDPAPEPNPKRNRGPEGDANEGTEQHDADTQR